MTTPPLPAEDGAGKSATWYRVEVRRFAPPLDEFDEPMGRGSIKLGLCEFAVVSTTPKGVWLDDFGRSRFVLQGARKRFACPTIPEAYESFRARKQAQLRILQRQIEDVERMLHLAEAEQLSAPATPSLTEHDEP